MRGDQYDVIIVGSGPGGGTVAWKLAQTGKRILLLERGGYLRRERENWDSKAVFDRLEIHPHLFPRDLYLGKNVPIGGTAHQAGTMRFGPDPATAVLDLNCRAHSVDNLYVTDASFFPSIGAVNPTLTIIANALRVAEVIERRLR